VLGREGGDVERQARRVLTTREPARGLELTRTSESGKVRHYEVNCFPIGEPVGRGGAVGVLATLVETTASVRAQTERQEAQRTARLLAASRVLADASTAEEMASSVATEGRTALGASAVAVYWISDAGDALRMLAESGLHADRSDQWDSIPLRARVPIAASARSGAPVVLESPEAMRVHYPATTWGDTASESEAFGAGALVCLPLSLGGRIVGVLALGFDRPDPLTFSDMEVATGFAQQSAQALERARLYDAERRARADAEGANAAKSRFMAAMSQELRTPLNAIAGYVELLAAGLRGPITREQDEDLSRIRTSQRNLLRLIDDVLTYSRLDSGAASLELDDVPVAPVINDALADVMTQLRSHGLRHEVHLPDSEITVRADGAKLRRMLVALLTHAIALTEPDGLVTVACEQVGAWALLRVRDTGAGLPAHTLLNIFEPFVQVDPSISRRHESTGLGLAISRELARAMGGELTAESREGEGTTFTLALPVP